MTRRELARAFGLPLERVRVVAEPLGGAFGGKFALVEPLAAGAALALRRPVRLVFTRAEDFQATNPASAQVMEVTIGGRKDGTLTAITARMVVDRGSNAELGRGGERRRSSSPARTAGRRTTSAATASRRTGSRSAPTAAPARRPRRSRSSRSSTSSRAKLGLDPLELRLQNAVVEGDVGVSGSPFPVIGAVEVLERIREHPLWSERGLAPRRRRRRCRRRLLAGRPPSRPPLSAAWTTTGR